MKIIIKGEAKEVAFLASAVQETVTEDVEVGFNVNQVEHNRNGESGPKTFSKKCSIATDNGTKIADAAISITTLQGFHKENTEAVLSEFAQTCRAFYLEAGNVLRGTEESETVSEKDAIRNCIGEMFRAWATNAKDGRRIALTEDDLQEDSRKECAVREKAEDVILRRFQDCLDSKKPLSYDDFRDIMNSRNTLEWILKMKDAYRGPLSEKERVICEKAEDIILKQYQCWLDSEKPMSSDDFNAMMDSVKTLDWFYGMKGAYS